MYLDASSSLETMRLFEVGKGQAIKYATLKFSESHGLPTVYVLLNVFPTHKRAEDLEGVKPDSYKHGSFNIN